jgi:hypothetical protein
LQTFAGKANRGFFGASSIKYSSEFLDETKTIVGNPEWRKHRSKTEVID